MSSVATSAITSYYHNNGDVQVSGDDDRSPGIIHYDLVTFLSIAQALDIDILPLMWNALDKVGQGATGLVHESTIDASTKFAFKRSCRLFKSPGASASSKAYRILIQEIFLLGIPPIRSHPGIVNIEGICWEVDDDQKVSPVLVFQKAEKGDLGQYLKEETGQGVSGFRIRLGLCHDIGNAIATLHSNNIVHGDIKPENILVFTSCEGEPPSAKIIDFGYSSFGLSEYQNVQLPRSPIWHAPECDGLRPGFSLREAKAADVFSFGLVCLYTLFPEDFDQDPKSDRSLHHWRQSQCEILPRVHTLLSAEKHLDEGMKLSLSHFFSNTLQAEPKSRTIDFSELMRNLHCASFPVLPEYNSNILASESLRVLNHATFRLANLIFPLSAADYRVRVEVRQRLEDRAALHCTTCQPVASFQLSIGTQIGFAHPVQTTGVEDSPTAGHWLKLSGKTESDLAGEILYARNEISLGSKNDGCRTRGLGLPDGDALAQVYSKAGLPVTRLQPAYEAEIDKSKDTLGEFHPVTSILEEALIAILHRYGLWKIAEQKAEGYIRLWKGNTSQRKQDYRTAIYRGQGHLDPIAIAADGKAEWNPTALAGMSSLAKIYHAQERYDELEKIAAQVQDIGNKFLGENDAGNVNCMSNLASAYYKQGRLAEAEKLQISALEKSLKLVGQDRRETIVAMFNLATTYTDQSRWAEAKKLQEEGLEICRRVLGNDHPETLIAMGNVASTYRALGQNNSAEKLDSEILEKRKRMVGPDHRETIIGMGNLACTYSQQGRLAEAEELDLETLRLCLQELGPDKRDTLISMGNLASTYRDQGRFAEAEKLELQVVEKRTELYGEDHRETLIGIGNLAATYRRQGRHSEAETLELKVVEKRRRVLGAEHSDTLHGMANLALTYMEQGRLHEARDLLRETLEICERALGVEHPTTLRAMDSLVSIYVAQGSVKDAAELQFRIGIIKAKAS